jgi:hypothetical protein
MTNPGTAPDNDAEYMTHAGETINRQDMEALGANSEQGFDMDQFILHQQYIGWIMGVAQSKELPIEYKGGNLFTLTLEPLKDHTFVIPYPPEGWKP